MARRAAASSMARAMPSSDRHTRAMRATSPGPGSNPAAARARSRNSATASAPSSSSGCNDRPGTGKTCSNGSMRRVRLVASTRVCGHVASSRSTKTATPSTRCSQLSSTIRASDLPRRARTASSMVPPGRSATPRTAATAAATIPGSEIGTRSTNQTASADLDRLGGDRDGEPGLAHAAGTDGGDEPVTGDGRAQCLSLRRPADEGRERRGDRRRQRPRGGEGCGHHGATGPVGARRLGSRRAWLRSWRARGGRRRRACGAATTRGSRPCARR